MYSYSRDGINAIWMHHSKEISLRTRMAGFACHRKEERSQLTETDKDQRSD